jgi:cytoplasmic iron level regulating protein YaaA (DUF328/UPF0246 family)
MKILLAPSEGKNNANTKKKFNYKNLYFSSLHSLYKNTITLYDNFVLNNNLQNISSWMGIKNLDDIKIYKINLNECYCDKAINIYSGEAFKALNYNSLKENEQKYVLDNVLIHSNLFGILRAFDDIPIYKFKQGAKLEGKNLNALFKKNLTPVLDEFLGNELIIDLRAKHYEKFYIPKKDYIIFEFYKNNKQISHFSKVYRGLTLRHLAINNIKTTKELENMKIERLNLLEIVKIKNKTIYRFNILD